MLVSPLLQEHDSRASCHSLLTNVICNIRVQRPPQHPYLLPHRLPRRRGSTGGGRQSARESGSRVKKDAVPGILRCGRRRYGVLEVKEGDVGKCIGIALLEMSSEA